MDPIHYQTIRANGIDFRVATAGTGPRLALCLHGFPESAYSWRYQMPLLAHLGYRVWAPDLRGYGGSSRPTGVAAYALENLEEDVAALIEASAAKEVVLVGHDWGASIAWGAALMRPDRFTAVFCLTVPYVPRGDSIHETTRQICSFEVSTDQSRLGEVRPAEVRLVEGRLPEVRSV